MGTPWSAPGSSSSSSGQDGAQTSRMGMERNGSAALGPFSFDEFGQLNQLFA